MDFGRKEGNCRWLLHFSRQKNPLEMRVGVVKQNHEEGSLTMTFSRVTFIGLHIIRINRSQSTSSHFLLTQFDSSFEVILSSLFT